MTTAPTKRTAPRTGAPDRWDQPLTIEEAAARLGVRPRLVRRLVTERRIGFVRVGRFIRLRPHDLEAYLNEHHQPAVVHRRTTARR